MQGEPSKSLSLPETVCSLLARRSQLLLQHQHWWWLKWVEGVGLPFWAAAVVRWEYFSQKSHTWPPEASCVRRACLQLERSLASWDQGVNQTASQCCVSIRDRGSAAFVLAVLFQLCVTRYSHLTGCGYPVIAVWQALGFIIGVDYRVSATLGISGSSIRS